MTAEFTDEQIEVLLRPLRAARVSQMQGFSYLESWDVRAHLIRLFGFGGFDIVTHSCDLVYEREKKIGSQQREGWEVCYKAHVELRVAGVAGFPDRNSIAVYSEYAIGSATGASDLPGLHDNAAKSAVSGAMKRCATNLGTQFGLSLYDNGNTNDVVRTIVGRDAPADVLTPEQTSHLETSLGAKPIGTEGPVDGAEGLIDPHTGTYYTPDANGVAP